MNIAPTMTAFEPLAPGTRCDADASELAVAQVLVNGEVLHFCGHHFRVNESVITEAGYAVSVPDHESKPMTWRRAAELGQPEQRDAGTGTAADAEARERARDNDKNDK